MSQDGDPGEANLPDYKPRYYNKHGVPISMEQWAELFEDFEGRRIARDEVGPWVVSTVWLGLDHSFLRSGPPLIFETMVFGGVLDDEMDRYSTLEEAQEGHARILAKVTEMWKLDQELDEASRG